MNPHQKNKVDINVSSPLPPPILLLSPLALQQANRLSSQSLSPEEQRLFRLYGKLPSRSDHLAKHLKERKYFDSGDYAMSKAGKGDSVDAGAVGSQHPVPENIPHLATPASAGPGHPKHAHHPSVSGGQAGSPVKESSFLHRETSVEDSIPSSSTPAAAEKQKGPTHS